MIVPIKAKGTEKSILMEKDAWKNSLIIGTGDRDWRQDAVSVNIIPTGLKF